MSNSNIQKIVDLEKEIHSSLEERNKTIDFLKSEFDKGNISEEIYYSEINKAENEKLSEIKKYENEQIIYLDKEIERRKELGLDNNGLNSVDDVVIKNEIKSDIMTALKIAGIALISGFGVNKLQENNKLKEGQINLLSVVKKLIPTVEKLKEKILALRQKYTSQVDMVENIETSNNNPNPNKKPSPFDNI